MGLGYWLTEKLEYNVNTGELITDRTWNYYVPQAQDIPQDLRVYFRKKTYTDPLIFGSKGNLVFLVLEALCLSQTIKSNICYFLTAVGEPPICLAISVPFAIREAVSSARLETGIPTSCWFEIGTYIL